MIGSPARVLAFLLTVSSALGAGIPVAGADHDGDPFNDAAEGLLCGFPAVAAAINSLPSEAGECATSEDYQHPWLSPGPTTGDLDADRFPDELEGELCGRQDVKEAIDGTRTYFGHYCASSLDYSPPTTNADLLVPTAATTGGDADLDGFPTTLTLTRLHIVARPFGAVPLLTVAAGPDDVHTVDANDDDPNVPAVSVLTLPSPIPTGHILGADSDRDGFPSTATVTQSSVEFDRRSLDPITLTPAVPISTTIDVNDADPNTPLVSVFTAPVPVPTGFLLGPDIDRDGFPTQLTLNRADVTFDRRDPLSPITLSPAVPVTQVLDPDDANPDSPATSVVVLPVPIATGFFLGGDADLDDVPSTANIQRSVVTFDRRGPDFIALSAASDVASVVDPDDNDPNVPAASFFGPVSVPMGGSHSPDADDDYVPHHATVSFLDVSVDRRSSNQNNLILGSHMTQVDLDENDADRGEPVPFDVVDADADLIPDAIEPRICRAQNINYDDDGRCGDPDGSDPNDYTPPFDAPNPWSFV